jgi:outer membrane protein OmpA-like peptidoglycan-associated protein
MGGPAGAMCEAKPTEKAMTTNVQPTHGKNELLRELVIVIGCLAMLLSGVGALYWMQTRPEEASAGTSVVVAAAPADAKSVETARPKSGVVTPDGAVVHADVYFDFKSARLRADAAKLLQDKAATMSRTETWAVLVTGYADIHGPAVYNKVLAQRRADTVKQFLVELGVPESSVKVVALGPEAALCDDPGTECQQLNRRVHLEIRRLGPVASVSTAPSAAAAPMSHKADELGQP